LAGYYVRFWLRLLTYINKARRKKGGLQNPKSEARKPKQIRITKGSKSSNKNVEDALFLKLAKLVFY